MLIARDLLCSAAAVVASSTLTPITVAQSYPTRPITMVVPYGAGGATDTIARILVDGMRGPLGQPIIVENMPGASGTIAVGRVARSPSDGYTLVLGNWATHVLNGPMFALRYDLQKDFHPVSLVANEPLLIVARKTMAANTLQEFVAWLKANPDQATQGTTGAGGITTIFGMLLKKESDTHFRFVAYRGGQGPAMLDLLAGQIDFMVSTSANALSQSRLGAIKAYAVTSNSRLAVAPDIPTVDEAGLPGLHALNWQAVFLPKSPPGDVVAKLNGAIVAALADPAVQRRLGDLGQEIFSRDQQTPGALASLQAAEIDRWWPIIKEAKIKAEP